MGGDADTLVFDSSGGHYLREKRALMGILSSRHAQASAPSSPAAINGGKYASLDQDEVGYLQSRPLHTVARLRPPTVERDGSGRGCRSGN